MELTRTLKHRDSLYRCQRCGWCRVSTYHDHGIQRICPIYEYDEGNQWEHSISRGHVALIRALLQGDIEPDPDLLESFYKCTVCGNCESICSTNVAYLYGYQDFKGIEHVRLFEDFRADLVDAGYGPLPQHKVLIDSIGAYDNPWFQPRSTRDRWTREVRDIKILDASKEQVDVLLYVGCTASYDATMRYMATSTARILAQAGIKFGILGKAERCCGSTLLRCGVEKDFARLAGENIELFNKTNPRTLITPCAGCFKTIRQDYPRVGELNFEVLHLTQYIAKLVKEGLIEFEDSLPPLEVTWHDPCHLGRALGIYDEPRDVLYALPGVSLTEMNPTREYAMCCGAGGGVRTAFPDLATTIAAKKLEKVTEMGLQALVSSCPFCEQNFANAATAHGVDVEVMNLGVLVANRMKKGNGKS